VNPQKKAQDAAQNPLDRERQRLRARPGREWHWCSKKRSDWFGVTCTDEGIAVRKGGRSKADLILTSFVPGEESAAGEARPHCRDSSLRTTCGARRCGGAAREKARGVSFENRYGNEPAGHCYLDMECFARQLAKCKHLQLTGIFSHFASSEVFTDTAVGQQTREQEERFYAGLDRLRALAWTGNRASCE